MTNPVFAFIEQEGEVLVHDIENDAKIAFTFLKAEAVNVWNWLKAQAASPAVQSLWAQVLAEGEQALQAVAKVEDPAVQAFAQTLLGDMTSLLANAIQVGLGNAAAAAVAPFTTGALTSVFNIIGSIAQAALANVMSKLAPTERVPAAS